MSSLVSLIQVGFLLPPYFSLCTTLFHKLISPKHLYFVTFNGINSKSMLHFGGKNQSTLLTFITVGYELEFSYKASEYIKYM